MIVKSQKERDQIICENYIYEKKRITLMKTTWRCIRKLCNSLAQTEIQYQNNLSSFVLIYPHNHEPDTVIALKKIMLEKMKVLMIESNLSPRNVVFTILRGLETDVIRAMGSVDNIYRCLRYYRQKFINPPPYIYNFLKLSESLCKTHTGSMFYQYGIGNYRNLEENSNILLFFSDQLAGNLINNEVWTVDGTFSVVPSPYMQLYTIGYIKNHHIFPCVFAVLKNKRKENYISLFRILNSLIGQGSPLIFKTDFEYAAIKAIEFIFPASRISGCMFHFGQCIIRKIGELHLKNLYQTSNQVKKFVRALSALSFVRIEMLEEQYFLLLNNPDFPSCLTPLYDYFFNTFIGTNRNARYPPSIWHSQNINDKNIPKTNNAIEGWHNTFKNTFGSTKFSFHLLVLKLKNEEDAIRIRTIQHDVLGIGFLRKKKYIQMENRLFLFLNFNVGHEHGLIFLFNLIELLFY